jgi:hypothetical protein
MASIGPTANVVGTMAHFQRILEGESYVMGSLVAVTVFQIMQGYVKVIECDDTEPSIKSLAKVLLTVFDTQYAPACSDAGKVKYHCKDNIGKYKRSSEVALCPLLP